MKVTKGEHSLDDKEVIAFYACHELVFRAYDSDKNYVLGDRNYIHEGGLKFEVYLKIVKNKPDFIAFYKGDTINIQL